MSAAELLTNSTTPLVENIDPVLNTRALVLDDMNSPTLGGQFEPTLDLNDTEVIATSSDRNPPLVEVQKPISKPVELAPNLRFNPIPKWDMELEMNRFIQDANRGLEEGLTLEQAVGKSAEELEKNVRSYRVEIITSSVVIPHLNRFGLTDGRLRMVGNNGEPIVNAISAQERYGAPLDASIFIENGLLTAPNNSFAVLESPPGWTGFVDEEGQDVSPHRNSQTLIFWKDPSGFLKGLTLHTDLNYQQAKVVMLELGVSEEYLRGVTDKDRLVNMVRHPALKSLPAEYKDPFNYVLDQILAKRGSHNFRLLQDNGTVEIRSVAKVREDIKRFEKVLQGSPKEEALIAAMTTFIVNDPQRVRENLFQQEIIDKVRETILFLTRIYLQDINQMPFYQAQTKEQLPYLNSDIAQGRIEDFFAAEIAYLQTRAGCPTTRSGSLRLLAGVSLGSAVFLGGTLTFSGGGGEIGKKGKSCISCGEVNYCTKKCYKCGGMLIG